jgi:predicted transcriptional regulator
MSTTTLRLDEELKSRVATAAERAGKTPHAFILEGIARTVEQAEVDAEFERVADERWARLRAGGRSVPWDDARGWLEARSRGERAKRPARRKPSR